MDVREMLRRWGVINVSDAFVELHQQIANAKDVGSLTDALLNACEDCECSICGAILCPQGDFFHFHHDGCPSCHSTKGYTDEQVEAMNALEEKS